MASLLVASGSRSGESFWLGERANIIGRGQWASMRILDVSASEEHARVYLDPASGGHCICPLDPRNPVFVNGRRIMSDRRLLEEDRILLGNTVLVFTQRDVGARRPSIPCPGEADRAAVATSPAPVAGGGSLPEDERDEEVCGWMAVQEGALVTFVRWFTDQSSPSAGNPGPHDLRSPLCLDLAAAKAGRTASALAC